MKKLLCLLLTAGMALSVTACAGSKDNTSSQNPSSVVSSEASSSEAESSSTPETSSSEASSAPSAAETKTLDCVLADGAMQTIVVQTTDGKTNFTFNKENAVINAPNGLQIGQKLRVTYTGELNSQDSSSAKLVQVDVIS